MTTKITKEICQIISAIDVRVPEIKLNGVSPSDLDNQFVSYKKAGYVLTTSPEGEVTLFLESC